MSTTEETTAPAGPQFVIVDGVREERWHKTEAGYVRYHRDWGSDGYIRMTNHTARHSGYFISPKDAVRDFVKNREEGVERQKRFLEAAITDLEAARAFVAEATNGLPETTP